MNELDRLEDEARSGDADAARRWLVELRRQGHGQRAEAASAELIDAALQRDDHRGLAALAIALDQLPRVCTALSLAWRQARHRRLAALGRALGLELDDAARAALEDLLHRVNHAERILSRADFLRGHARRQVGPPRNDRLLSVDDLTTALVSARLEPAGIGVVVGRPKAHGERAVVLAVRGLDATAVVVGATRCKHTATSPGSAWPQLKPWRKDLSRNRPAADLWARQQGLDDRVSVPALELPDDARALLQQQAGDAVDPVLGALLAEPSRSGFNTLVRQLHTARGDARDRLAAALEHGLADWPDTVRVGTRSWLESLAADHRKGTWRPGWQLVRRLELDDKTRADDPGLEALLHSPFVGSLGHLVLRHVDAGVLARLATHDWPALRRIELTTDDPLAAVDTLLSNPALAARIDALDVGAARREGALPDALQPPTHDGITLVLRWPSGMSDAVCADTVRALFEHTDTLEAVQVTWFQGALAWLEPGAARGGLVETRHLSLDVDLDDTDALVRLLDGDARPRNLDTLVLGWSGSPLDALVDLANGRALARLRCLALLGTFVANALPRLARTEMAHPLEALYLWPFRGIQLDARTLVEMLCAPGLAGLRTLGLPAHDVLYTVRQTRDRGALADLERLLVAGADAPTVERLGSLLGGSVRVDAVEHVR